MENGGLNCKIIDKDPFWTLRHFQSKASEFITTT